MNWKLELEAHDQECLGRQWFQSIPRAGSHVLSCTCTTCGKTIHSADDPQDHARLGMETTGRALAFLLELEAIEAHAITAH